MLCTNCNTRHTVLPPGSEYVSVMLQPCPRIDYQKNFYNCIMRERTDIFIDVLQVVLPNQMIQQIRKQFATN